VNVIGWDVETHLIQPGMLAPRLVCVSTSDGGLFDRADGLAWFRSRLEVGDTLVAHNQSYDTGVLCAEDPTLLPLVFDALEGGRLRDTLTRERLINNARGLLTYDSAGKRVSYSLAAISKARWGEDIVKGDDTWQLRYAELDGVPVEEWPEEARAYALKDAELAKRLFDAQGEDPADEARQTCGAFWLHLSSMWGLRTDPTAVNALRRKLTRRVKRLSPFFIGSPYVRADGTKDTKAIRAKILETVPDVRRTPTGLADTSAETLEATGVVPLRALAAVARAEKLLSTYVPVLDEGTRRPLTPSYGFAESGRTTCREPNVQNLPSFPGVRECYIPRPGYVFASVDYDTLELRALAQVCLELFGASRMADELRAGRDLHLAVAANILGVTLEDVTEAYNAGNDRAKQARKLAKIASFGYSGGLGAGGFRQYAAGWGVEISEYDAKALKRKWLATFSEMTRYFDLISRMTAHGKARLEPPILPIVRGGLSYTECANTLFQGRAAAGAKEAGWLLTRACYEPGPLFGSRIVAFIHDEFLMEHPVASAQARMQEQVRLMSMGMQSVIRDVPVTASGKIMERWKK
jgi:DNA polymerase-1